MLDGELLQMKFLKQKNCMKINNFESPTITNRRIELKDVISPLNLPKVKEIMLNSNLSFEHSYDKRQINSISLTIIHLDLLTVTRRYKHKKKKHG